MTREEAKEILSIWLSNVKMGLSKDGERLGYIEGWFHQSDVKAFEMAIKALSAEPCNDCQRIYKPNPYYDCISRQNTIDAMWEELEEDTAHKVRDILEAQPPVIPKQDTCEDCISRQEAINKMQELEDEDIKTYGCEIPEGFDGKRAIRALKTLQPVTLKQTEWIPVSERLPENCDDVLVWIEYIKDDYNCAWWALAYYSLRYKKWVVSMNEDNPLVKVKAWMPLPEPYKSESEE